MEDADDEAKSKDKDQGLKRDEEGEWRVKLLISAYAPLQNVEGSATLEKRSSMKKRVGGAGGHTLFGPEMWSHARCVNPGGI